MSREMPRSTGRIEVDGMWWIIIGVCVVAVGVYGFWPRKRGLADRELKQARSRTLGKGDYFGGL